MKQTFDLSAIGLKECHFGPERFGDNIVFTAKAADGTRVRIPFAFAEYHPYVVYRVTQFGKRPVYLGLEADFCPEVSFWRKLHSEAIALTLRKFLTTWKKSPRSFERGLL